MKLIQVIGIFSLLTLLFSSPGMAENGFLHPSSSKDKVVRTGYGECIKTPFKDPGYGIDTGCYDDSDKDGVPDPMDKCPGTPEGVAVDTDGCPLDSDGDGVTDDKDQCPDTPKGAPVDENGCTLDSDGDGVTDDKDQCPNTPSEATVDENGCTLDSDGDGVPDYQDKCPNTPAGAQVDGDGCALKIILDNVQFETNKAVLTAGSMGTLDAVADALNARPDITKVTVIGHTDSMGDAGYNQSLSDDRAKAVADYLVSQGVDSNKVNSKGMGESQPVADNSTAVGRAKNRRVELQVR